MKFYTTVQLFESGAIPLALKGFIKETCDTCKAPIVMNEKLTFRKCGNPRCKRHLSMKASDMFKKIGTKGIGPETALVLLKREGLSNHLDLIPIIYKNDKPRVYLYEVAQLAMIDGLQDEAQQFLLGFNSFEEYEASEKPKHPVIDGHLHILKRAQHYFDIKPSFTDQVLKIMISGNLKGFTKQQFLDVANDISSKYFLIQMVGLNNKATFLVTEDYSTSTQKGQLARGELRAGVKIPIVNSSDFLHYVAMVVDEIEENKL